MIPKKIHYCWLSGDPYPALIENCIASWKKYLPDYEIVLWDYSKIQYILNPWLIECIENKKYAFAADYIRLYALYEEGGIYLDSDVEVLKSFDDLLTQISFIGTEMSGDLEPAVIGSVCKMEWLSRCLSYYSGRSFVMNNGNFDTKPLPSIIGEILAAEYKLEYNINLVSHNPGISLVVYPASYFSPKSIYSSKVNISDESYSVHHFDGSWVKKDVVYYLKHYVHAIMVYLFGKRIHNLIIQKFFR